MPRYCISSSSQLHLWWILSSFWIWLSWIQCLNSCALVINSPWHFFMVFLKATMKHLKFILWVHMCVCPRVHVYYVCMVHVLGSEDNLQESVLSLYLAGPKDCTQAIIPGSKHFYPLSHLTSPNAEFISGIYSILLLFSSLLFWQFLQVSIYRNTLYLYSVYFYYYQEFHWKTGEIVQRLKVFATLSENTGSIPSFHTGVRTIRNSSSRASGTLL